MDFYNPIDSFIRVVGLVWEVKSMIWSLPKRN